MAINWDLARPRNEPDVFDTLRALGAQQDQRRQVEQQQLRQNVGTQVQAGDFRGAADAASRGGDLDLVSKIYGLEATKRKQVAEESRILAAAATRLRGVPVDQREGVYGQLAPMLRRYFGHDELASADLSDSGLDSYIEFGRSILDHSDAQDEPSVVRSLRAIGIDPQSEQGRDLVTRSIAAPRFIQKPDGSFMVVGGGPGPGSGSASAAPPSNARGPAPGAIEDGYRFRGGNPADPSAWEQVGGAPSQGGATFR